MIRYIIIVLLNLIEVVVALAFGSFCSCTLIGWLDVLDDEDVVYV